MSWGYHLTLDCKAGDMDAVTNSDTIKEFSNTLVERIDMVPYGDPIVEHFATHDPDKAGYTLVQLIETSNITCHFCDKDGNFYMDVFSCKTFDTRTVIDLVNTFFKPENIKTRYFTRDATE